MSRADVLAWVKAVWRNEWTPAGLLAEPDYVAYDEPVEVPGGFLYGSSKEYGYSTTKRTPWGAWVDELPGLVALGYLILHYLVFGILFVVVCPAVGFMKLIHGLLTKKWGDI